MEIILKNNSKVLGALSKLFKYMTLEYSSNIFLNIYLGKEVPLCDINLFSGVNRSDIWAFVHLYFYVVFVFHSWSQD